MRFPIKRQILAFVVLVAAAASTEAAPLRITVSIPPQKYFVERIGGDHVEVTVMVGPGESPATYEPKASQLAGLASADVYFTTGVSYERTWMKRIKGVKSNLSVVDTTQGISFLDTPGCSHAGHEHGEGHDPHVWLSPRRVEQQATLICQTLSGLAPAHADLFAKNLESFANDLRQLDREIADALSGLERRTLLVFHPVWTYFAHDYELNLIPVEIGGQEPSARELAGVIRLALEKGVTTVLAQPEFSTRSAELVARQVDGKVLLLSPLSENWLLNMRKATAAIAEALSN